MDDNIADQPQNAHTILIIDDVKLVQNSLRRLFRKSGYDIVTASSAPEALEVIAKHQVDLAICDLGMPGVSGEDLLVLLNKHFPELPCIVLSGSLTEDNLTVLRKMKNIKHFLAKPWSHEKLVMTIKEIFGEEVELETFSSSDDDHDEGSDAE